MKFIILFYMFCVFSSCRPAKTENLSQLDSQNQNNTPSLSFAAPWWLPDYPKFMTKGPHFDTLKKAGYDTIKLWVQHITPGGTTAFDKGRFGYKCKRDGISHENCPYYFQAIEALNFSNMKVDIEVPINHPKHMWPEDESNPESCIVSGQEKALRYGRDNGNASFYHSFEPWLQNGGRIDTIILDGPLNKTMQYGVFGNSKCGFKTMEDALLGTVTWMETVQNAFARYNKKVNFVYLVNFPQWKSSNISSIEDFLDRKGDFIDVIKIFPSMTKARNLNLLGFEFDNPFHDLIDLERRFISQPKTKELYKKLKLAWQEIRNQGLQFRYITITGAQHIEQESFPLRFNEKEAKMFHDETTIYADFIKANFGSYLHNITLQSWLETPFYIFQETGPYEFGMMHNALAIAKRIKAPYCNRVEYIRQKPQLSGSTFAQVLVDYHKNYTRENLCMPITDFSGECSPYYYLLKTPEALDHTLNASKHYRGNQNPICKPDEDAPNWMEEGRRGGRRTRLFKTQM